METGSVELAMQDLCERREDHRIFRRPTGYGQCEFTLQAHFIRILPLRQLIYPAFLPLSPFIDRDADQT
jgi:hypothetical protein